MRKWSIISKLEGVYVKLKRRMMAYKMVSSFRITRLFVLTVIVPLIAIIIFIMFDSPNSIQSRFNPESQWIPFYASYLGGIFGGIISGGLTLGGVYLTIRHQNKLLNKEKAAKMSYICRKMEKEIKILDKLIKNKHEFSDSGLLHEVERCAERLLGIIADNTKYIMETDFVFMSDMDIITDQLNSLAKRDFDKSDRQMIHELKGRNESIRLTFRIIKNYIHNFH